MKKAEYERRIHFDDRGVQLLGIALFLNAQRNGRTALERVETLEKKAADAEVGYVYVEALAVAKREVEESEERLEWYRDWLSLMEADPNLIERAQGLKALDFRFRWDHLYKHKMLLGYAYEEGCYLTEQWNIHERIVNRRPDDALIRILEEIFLAELDMLRSDDPDDVPYPRTPDEMLFFTSVWRLCTSRASRGRPAGRRQQDGLDEASDRVVGLLERAERNKEKPNVSAIIKEVLKDFRIVSRFDFDQCEDKLKVIVTDAASGPELGAEKALRKHVEQIRKRQLLD